MTTHMTFDPWLNEETVAEVRHHWDGPYHFGAPTDRTRIQEPFVREQQIDPDEYYPEGYKPERLEE